MLETILELCHYSVILAFGIYLSASFLGIIMNRRNVLILLGFFCVAGLFNLACFLILGTDMTEMLYPLIIHLPLILFLHFFYKIRLISAMLSVFVVYLCCQISNWVGIFALYLSREMCVYYAVRVGLDLLILFLMVRYASHAMEQVFRKPTKVVLIIGLVPFVYYIYDYAVTVYTDMLYSGGKEISEFLGFLLCVFYIIFVLIYFQQYEENREVEQRNQLMEMQRIQSQKEIERMKQSEYQISILRHDMRHYLTDVLNLVEAEELEHAKTYIGEVLEQVELTVPKKYCSNILVNMILSSYAGVMEKEKITFQYFIRIPTELNLPDSDISSILSNGLENAVHAVSLLPVKKRKIELDMRVNNEKLLISIKNTYCGKLELIDGIPHTNEPGHGFGTKSICYVTEKLKGKCDFSISEEYFILRIVL